MRLLDTISRTMRYLMPGLFNERGEVAAPFIESLPEEVRTSLPEEIVNDPEIANFKDLGEVLTAAKSSRKPWIESLPEELKNDPNISKYKSSEELAKGHLNAVKLVGAKGVIIPGKDAKPEEVEKFYNALGRPEKPEGYKLTPIENLHPSIKEKYTPEAEAVFKAEMHKIGLTNAQVDALHKWYFENASKGELLKEQATEKAIKDGEAALRQKYGKEYDIKLANAIKIVKKFGGQEAIDALGDTGSHPAVVKMMMEISNHFSEDMIKSFGEKKTEGSNAAKEKIKTILADKSHPYWKGDSEAIKEVTKLYQEAYPNET